jgi:putative hemolysin
MTPLLVFLLACAGVYVGVIAAAFSALMRLSLRLAAERSGRDDRLGRYLEEPLRLFIPVRVLLAMLPVLVAVLLFHATGVSSARGIALLLAGVFVFIVVFEHMIPLLIIRRDPERVLDVLLPSFEVVARLLQPVTAALRRIGELAPPAERPSGADGEPPEQAGNGGSAAEAETAQPGEDRRLQELQDRALLRSIVDFRDSLVREVMTPRPDIVAIHGEATLGELRALFQEQEYSRIPVFSGTLDNILGFIFVKDLINVDAPDPNQGITTLLRPAYVVPETKRVPELLREFQRERVQSAIVVDEYGGTAGLVTLEDLLEEIVGEIRDEYDVETEAVVDEGEGVWLFSGKADVDDLADRIGIDVPRDGFETVGGYLMSHLGRVPAVGETFEVEGLSVEVLEAERRRINKVRIRRREAVLDDASEPAR